MTFQGLIDFLYGSFQESLWPMVTHYIIILSPIFAAIFLGIVFWDIWVRYVQLKNFLGIKYTVLELRLPKDTFKSPLAMETVLHAIHNTSDGSYYARYWKGETRPWYSLEIISVEGNVKFLIWTEDQRKNNLKSALYSQYPGIEIYEIDDYAKNIQYDPKVWKLWAAEFKFNKPDPYPIKTYVDFGLDKDPKEEFKVDPLVHMLEWLGSLRPNEQAWFQFVVRAHKNEQRKAGHLWKVTDKWKDDAQSEVNKILIRDPKTKVAGEINPETGFGKLPTISKGEQEIVAAIERSLQKLPFDVCVRGAYIAKRDIFDTPFGIGGIIASLKQFNTEHLNGFRPNGKKWIAKFDYPWQDYKNIRRTYLSKMFLKAYRRRSAFYPPFKTSSMVLNTEELATIYHLPGSVAGTPTLKRVPSKKSEAPTNLPV
ncbi:MAG: hypothetical protein NT077_04735 [Candidatus Taylorbacteria bacterium]|nr:hypothetical protein [Candidatus Taylorbacteria bacterium]